MNYMKIICYLFAAVCLVGAGMCQLLIWRIHNHH